MVDGDTAICGEPRRAEGGHEQIEMGEEERVKKAVESITILTEESHSSKLIIIQPYYSYNSGVYFQ